jgi:hypothetical protein
LSCALALFLFFILTVWPQGAFPSLNVPTSTHYQGDGAQPIPVYTAARKDTDDVFIRAYNNCPAISKKLKTWYASSEFMEMSKATKSFRDHVANLQGISMQAMKNLRATNPTDPFALENWYNVWDEFNTRNTTNGEYGNALPNAGDMPMFAGDATIPGTGGLTTIPAVKSRGNSLLGQITWLAFWLETTKVSSSRAGALFAGPILSDLSARIDAATEAHMVVGSNTELGANFDPTTMFERLVIISSHYNVQLGVLSALEMDKYMIKNPQSAPYVPWVTVPELNIVGLVPSAAATLVFELHASSMNMSAYAVRAVYQNGPGPANNPRKYAVIPLPCESAAGAAIAGKGACTLADFQTLLGEPIAAAGPSRWCEACQATVPMPCVAQRAMMNGALRPGMSVGLAAWMAVVVAFVAQVIV